MKYHVTVGDREYVVEVDGKTVRLDGEEMTAELVGLGAAGHHALRVGQVTHDVHAARNGVGSWILELNGRTRPVRVVDERRKVIEEMTRATAGPSGPKPVKAPMPGLVIAIHVEPGQHVAADQGVAIVEAMKMENELRTSAEGTVDVIHVSPGQTVEKDEILIEFRGPADSEAK